MPIVPEFTRLALRAAEPRRTLGGRGAVEPVSSTEHILAALQRERARTDRNGRDFSLVLFRVKNRSRLSPSTWRLLKTIISRARATDEIGWFDEQNLCAILPDTPSGGAWRFAQDVCDRIAERAPRPLCQVYSYPANWFDDGKDHRIPPVDLNDGPDNRRDDNGDDSNAHHDGNGHGKSHVNGNRLNGNDPVMNGHGGNGGTLVLNRRAENRTNGGADARLVTAGAQSLLASRPVTRTLRPQLAAAMMSEDVPGLQSGGVSVAPLHNFLVRPLPWWKRAIDITGASVGLFLTAPVLILAAAAIKLTSPGPVMFKQQRAGLGGKPFWIFKLRTMCVDAEAKKAELRKHSEQDGPAFKMKNDPRITPIGRVLRETSIDELPQLINVLKGDMTLVGPRPLPISESAACDQWQRRRLDVTPGLTCIWQVRGRSTVSFADWVRMDIEYIRKRTMMQDIKLILQTIPAVLAKKGAR